MTRSTKNKVLGRLIKVVDKMTNFVMIVFFLLLMLIGGYAVYDSYRVYDDVKLGDDVLSLRPKIEDGFSIEPLRKINADVDGWIRIFGTRIDYPVLYSYDNMNYLNVDYNGKYTPGGSIFIDYRNARDFKDDYTITYGHNMTTGQMYSDIKNYEDKEYFDRHLMGVLYTVDGVYQIEVLYFALINAYDDDAYNLNLYRNAKNEQIIEMVNKRAFNGSGVLADGDDKLILLSTCDSFGSNDRSVLLAKMTMIESEDEYAALRGALAGFAPEWNGDGENDVDAAGRKLWCFLILILIIILVIVIIWKIREKRRERRERLKK